MTAETMEWTGMIEAITFGCAAAETTLRKRQEMAKRTRFMKKCYNVTYSPCHLSSAAGGRVGGARAVEGREALPHALVTKGFVALALMRCQ